MSSSLVRAPQLMDVLSEISSRLSPLSFCSDEESSDVSRVHSQDPVVKVWFGPENFQQYKVILYDEDNLSTLVERFCYSADPIHFKKLATQIFEQCLDSNQEMFSRLRKHLLDELSDEKKACLLQLLAQLGDNASVNHFIEEISNHSSLINPFFTITPSLPLVVAITYIRFLKVPEEYKALVVKNVQSIVIKCKDLNFAHKKALTMGAVITLGVLSQLDEETLDFFVDMLVHDDTDIVEETIESLSCVWETTEKKNLSVLQQYRQKVCEELKKLALKYKSDITNTRKITPSKAIVSRTLLLLARVEPEFFIDLLLDSFANILEMDSAYLNSSILAALEYVPKEIQVDFFTNILDSKTIGTRKVVTLLVER